MKRGLNINMKNVKEFIKELSEAGIVAIATEKDKRTTIDLSMSDKKELCISENSHNYDLHGANFKIGDDFVIEIHGYECCEVHAGDNCQITVFGFGPTVTANNDCKINVGWEGYIYCENNNIIECGEDTKIECNENNKITAENGKINVKGERDNEVYIDELNEYDGQYYIELNSGSKINIGNIEIPIS